MIKKTVIEGREVKQVFTSPLAFLHAFFGTRELEKPAIRYISPEYRQYKKKIKSEGRLTNWGAIQPIKEKVR
jgi:hypothetical protein